MNEINPLGVCHKVRDFQILQYWRDKINQIDILYIEYFDYTEALQKSKKFFMENKQYTHYVFIHDDILITPSHIDLLLEDIKQFYDKVVCGYSNIDFQEPSININFKDLRGVLVRSRKDYNYPSIYDVLSNKFSYPFVKVFFQGWTLTALPRNILEKLSFSPYFKTYDNVLGKTMLRGFAHDLQASIELANLGIETICDLRLLCMHFGNTLRFINLKDKTPSVYLKKKNGEVIKYE